MKKNSICAISISLILLIAVSGCSSDMQIAEKAPAPTSASARVTAQETQAPAQETQAVTTPPVKTPDLVSRPQVWFCPLPPMLKRTGRDFIGSNDFMDLFTEDAPWETAAARVHVFELCGEWVGYNALDDELSRAVNDLNRRGIAIGISTGPLEPTDTCYPPEGFVRVDESLKMLRRVKEAGGTVSYIDFDEPFINAILYDGPKAAHWTAEKAASEIGKFVDVVKTEFPDVQFGGSEPLLNDPYVKVDDIKSWIDAYEKATGTPLAFLHLDIDYTRQGWAKDAKEIEDFCRRRGVDFGIYYLGDGQDPTDEAWITHAGQRAKDYELVFGGKPDHILFESWHDHPDRVLPDTDPYTFTGFINEYFTDKNSLGVRTSGAGANLAFRKTVRASKSLKDCPAENAVDGSSGSWWSAGNPAPQWIEIDLGQPSAVTEVRLLLCQDPAGETTHRILVKGPGTDNKYEILNTFEGATKDSEYLIYKLPELKEGIRYIRIETKKSPSWVAWREIEVIGG